MRDHSIERPNRTELQKFDRCISTPPMTAEEMHDMRRRITRDPVQNTNLFVGTVLSEPEPFPQIRRNTDGSYEVLGIIKSRGTDNTHKAQYGRDFGRAECRNGAATENTARHYLLRIDEAGHITVRPIMHRQNRKSRLCY